MKNKTFYVQWMLPVRLYLAFIVAKHIILGKKYKWINFEGARKE